MEKIMISVDEARKLSFEEITQKLSCGRGGLSGSEAKERLGKFGVNALAEKKVNPILKFLSYFWGPIPWMIEVAAVLSAIIHHVEDFWIILALLLLNAGVGFWQEFKADNAIELLKRKLALKSKVKRDGKWTELPAKELVPGDLVRVRLGDIVPADIKLMEGDYLSADESALTGESLPVEKHAGDISYSGSIVRQGEMDALVFSTGMNTYFGRTAKLVETTKTVSHFQKAIVKIGDFLIILAVMLVSLIFIVALFRHESFLVTLKFALVLTVAAIPVAMPAVLSVAMAVGAIALAQRKAIVSKLASIEEMAGVDVLCSDKTGTITRNELSMAEMEVYGGYTENDVLLCGALASREEDKDTIDMAVINKAKERSELAGSLSRYKQVKFKPFDPVSKRTEAEVEDAGGKKFKVTKGAPQIVLSLVSDKQAIGAKVSEKINAFAEQGYRALGIARTSGEEGDWRLVGLVALSDAPREDSAQTIETAQGMGITVKMVTGDHLAIAKQIAQKVHLGTRIIEASALLHKSDKEAAGVVEEVDGFAQVFPEHKHRIVELLQEKGHIVAMTGDGVNDAPALKKADAGIAVDGATDAAKSAADIVLTMPGLSVIIDAIKESRKIFQRMTNYSIYRIAETVRVIFFIASSIIVFRFYPVTALMIVLLALLNDAPIMTIAYDNVVYSNKPERWVIWNVLGIATLLGVIGVIASFGIFYIGQEVFHLSPEILQSFIYLKLSVAGHLTVFVARTRGAFWTVRPALPLFLAVIITQLIATLIVVYGFLLPAMGWKLAFFVWGYALVAFVITDFLKVHFYRVFNFSGIKAHN